MGDKVRYIVEEDLGTVEVPDWQPFKSPTKIQKESADGIRIITGARKANTYFRAVLKQHGKKGRRFRVHRIELATTGSTHEQRNASDQASPRGGL